MPARHQRIEKCLPRWRCLRSGFHEAIGVLIAHELFERLSRCGSVREFSHALDTLAVDDECDLHFCAHFAHLPLASARVVKNAERGRGDAWHDALN